MSLYDPKWLQNKCRSKWPTVQAAKCLYRLLVIAKEKRLRLHANPLQNPHSFHVKWHSILTIFRFVFAYFSQLLQGTKAFMLQYNFILPYAHLALLAHVCMVLNKLLYIITTDAHTFIRDICRLLLIAAKGCKKQKALLTETISFS